MRNTKKIVAVAMILSIISALFIGCSNTENDSNKSNGKTEIIISLDYTPNTNHTGMYVALEKGYYAEAGLDVKIVQPPEDDAISACSSGKVQFAIGFQDLLAPAFGSKTPMQVIAVAALLQHNTGCIMTAKGQGIKSPKDLQGKEYLTWESPIEIAVMKKAVTDDGGDWNKVKCIPNTVTNEAMDIKENPNHAIWAYYGWGVINAQVSGVDVDTIFFRDIDPIFDYYSPVIVVSNDFMADNGDAVKAFLAATRKGYEYAYDNPDEAAEILIRGDDTGSLIGSEDFVKASQKWISKEYCSDRVTWGYIDPERWNAFYNWVNEQKLTEDPIQENTGFSNDYLE